MHYASGFAEALTLISSPGDKKKSPPKKKFQSIRNLTLSLPIKKSQKCANIGDITQQQAVKLELYV